MGSNTSKGRAQKGSKFWIQTIINSSMKLDLDKQLGMGTVKWLSPLKTDEYAEYALNQQKMLTVLGLSKEAFDFGPSNQPQWDAIGLAGEIIILVEAKANLEEVEHTKLKATNEQSIHKIKMAMKEVADQFYPRGNFDKWLAGYYQLGNRLTFLHKLNAISGKKVKLVLLNIIDDPTHKAVSMEKWQARTEEMLQEMTGSKAVPQDVIIVNFEV